MQFQPDLAHPRTQHCQNRLGFGEAIAVQDSVIRLCRVAGYADRHVNVLAGGSAGAIWSA
jgi:hypothetical protein